MKRLLLSTLALLLVLVLVACGGGAKDKETNLPETTNTPVDTQAPDTDKVDDPAQSDLEINVTVIAGTTGMGFAQIMDENAKGTSPFKYNFDIVSDASLASGAIISGTADMAAVPTNLAAVLYNKTNGGVQVVAVNTLGVLYLLTTNEVTAPDDIVGKTIYCCNQGANPEFISRYLLDVCADFNRFYHDCPVLKCEDENVRRTRLAIVKATSTVLKNGLTLIGLKTPKNI